MDYAIAECHWLDLEEDGKANKSLKEKHIDGGNKNTKYVGWVILGEDETKKRGLYDEQVELVGDNSTKKALRSRNNK